MMTSCESNDSLARRSLDRVAFAWIAVAPLVVAIGMWTGTIEPPVFPAGPPSRPPAMAQTVSDESSSPGTGQMRWRSPAGPIDLPVLDARFRVEVTGMMVHGTVEQSFTNPTDEVIEVEYVFPLPERAAVHDMEMRIGERRIVAVVQEREHARETYRQARDEGRKAALVEQDRPNLFRTSAANINPGERVEVVLQFVQELPYADREFELVVPLCYTPRFDPRAAPVGVFDDSGSVPTASVAEPAVSGLRGRPAPAPEVDLEVRIRAGFPLEEILSPSHELETWLDGETEVVSPRGDVIFADRDFVLRWRPMLGSEPRSAVHVEDRADGRHVLLMVLPPDDRFLDRTGLPTETLFILDVSGSMQGPSIRQARAAMMHALDRLQSDDAFNMVAFNDGLRPFRDRFVTSGGDEVAAARRWIADLRANGGTDIARALRDGIDRTRGRSGPRVRRIVFLTDGAVSNEDEVFRTVLRDLHEVRLNTIGLGNAPNRHLMDRMARLGGGVCTFIHHVDEAAERIDAFLRTLDRPVMTDVALEWSGARPREVFPERMPDIHAGQPLWVSARLEPDDSPAAAVLRGRLQGGETATRFDLRTNAPDHSGIAVRWARHKVSALIDSLHAGADLELVRGEVVAVATSHHLVTRYTSLVAVEEFSSALDPARRVEAANGLRSGSVVALPLGGTLDPLFRALGLLLSAVGLAGIGVLRWRHCRQ